MTQFELPVLAATSSAEELINAAKAALASAGDPDFLFETRKKKKQEEEQKVEEKFGEQNFRVLSEMRILGKNRVAILDFGRVSLFFSEILREFRF